METRNILIPVVAGLLLGLTGCMHESDLSVSGLDRNWYVLEDSDDELDHLRYLVYSGYGVAVYYNDTIGSREEGLDIYGNPIVYYEVVDPNYDLTSLEDEIGFSLSNDRNALIGAMRFMKDEVLPLFFSTEFLPRCFLLVDTVEVACSRVGGSYRHETDVYRSMMTSVIGKVGRLGGMSSGERRHLACEITAEELAVYMLKFRMAELAPFLSVSGSEVYSKSSVYAMNPAVTGNSPFIVPYKDFEDYGFLDYDRWQSYEPDKAYWTVDQRSDVVDFLTEVLLDDEEDFCSRYASKKWILKKYGLMKDILGEVRNGLQAGRSE